MFGNLR
jgi:hypothetical protein